MVRPNPIATGWIQAVLYMIVKLILVPMLMVGCCFAVGLEGAYARAAVLVATLPVSAGEPRRGMECKSGQGCSQHAGCLELLSSFATPV